MLKSVTLAAVAASTLALYATEASAQATPVFNSPAEARTYDTAPAVAGVDRRAAIRHRNVDAFAAAPVVGSVQQPNVTNKDTVYIRDY